MKTRQLWNAAARMERACRNGLHRAHGGLAVFTWLMLGLSPAMADDIDVYTLNISSGGSGAPVILFQLDSSGSMLDKIAENGAASNLIDQRAYRMIDTASAQISGMSPRFKSAIIRYVDPNTGQRLLTAQPLNTATPSVSLTTGGTSTFMLRNAFGDAQQLATSATSTAGDTTLSPQWNVSVGSSIGSGTSNYGSSWPQTYPSNVLPSDALPSPYPAVPVSSAGTECGMAAGRMGNRVIWYRHTSSTAANTFTFNTAPVTASVCITTASGALMSGGGPHTGTSFTTPSINFSNNTYYRIVIGTTVSGQIGSFTYRQNNNRGTFYEESQSYPRRVGLQYSRIDIPRGATITSAYLDFHNTTAQTTDFRYSVARDLAAAPLDFTNSLFNRTLEWQSPYPALGSIGGWSVESWSAAATNLTSDGFTRDDDTRVYVTTLMQNQVNQSGWCNGDITFMVQPAMPGATLNTRQTTAFDLLARDSGTRKLDTTLVVNWTPPPVPVVDAACATRDMVLNVTGSSDDAAQNASGAMSFTDTSIPVGLNRKAGLRFPLANIPQGATISEAYLQVVANATATTRPLTIQVVDALTGPAWASTTDFIDSLSLTVDSGTGDDTVAWTPPSWSAGTRYTSPNIAALIQPLVDNLGWSEDGTISVILSGTNSNLLNIRTWEHVAAGSVDRTAYGLSAARLVLKVTNATPIPVTRTQRQLLVDTLSRLDFSDNTPIAGTFVESAQFMLGRDGYSVPPLATGDCATNAVVFLTDGEETGSSYSTSNLVTPTTTITGTTNGTGAGKNYATCGTGDTNAQWNCVYNLMRALYDKRSGAGITADWDEDPGTANTTQYFSIVTHAIGFGPEALSTTSRLYQSGSQGGGAFHAATNADDLNSAFKEIIETVSISTASVAAPGVAVNALNKFEHLDELYYALFDPENKVRWEGNLKRYRLKDGAIVDVNGTAAISTTTGLFGEGWSWWSNVADNGVSMEGGSAGELTVPTNRKLYTYLGTNGTSMNVSLTPAVGPDRDGSGAEIFNSANTSGITSARIGATALAGWGSLTATQQSAKRAAIIEFARGGPDLTPDKAYGAIIHSAPSLVTYGQDGVGSMNTVFVSDIYGILHMIDTGGPSTDVASTNKANAYGNELFAFMPQEVMSNLAVLQDNTRTVPGVAGASYIYGLDGTWVPWKYDVDGDGIVESADGDKVYIYGGMRRGGSNYYALDVTSVRRGSTPAPQLTWVVQGGTTGAYANMGQTWAEPSPRWIKWNGARKRVVFFTGGYDATANDVATTFPGTVQKGRQVYMVDAITGQLLWWASSESTANTVVADMKYSLPSAPVTMDRNGNGSVDGFYITDIAGQVFRFDINEGATSATNFIRNNAPAVVGKFGFTGSSPITSEDHRRFIEAPAVAFVRSSDGGDLMIGLVSGHRELPTNKDLQDKAIVFRDIGAWNITPAARPTLTLSNLATLGATGELSSSDLNLPGWHMNLTQSSGEKGSGSPVFFNFALLFTAYVPGVASEFECAPPIGYSRLYAMNALTGGGIVNDELETASENQRYLDQAMPGMGSTVQMLYMDNQLTVVSGVLAIATEKLEDDDSSLLDASLFGGVRRSRWFEWNE